jgi:hypothetical protein
MLRTECQSLMVESFGQPELAAEITSLIELDKAVAGALDCATTDLFQCGCDRRTLMFTPHRADEHSTAAEKLRALRPLAAVVPADVDEVLILSEESGISPRSLAAGLERVFPGIADAARRLFTRIDVEWQSLG